MVWSIDEHPSCAKSGLAAGGHWDPQHTGHHLGPYGFGHLGDLPALTVTNNGDANLPVLAPRLKVKDLQGHSLSSMPVDTPILINPH